MKTLTISLTVNGHPVGPHEIPQGLSMNDYLREYLNLTGTKFGCGIGMCSACVVILDHPDGTSETVHTCITGADSFAGKSVRTIEGVARDGKRRQCRLLSSTTSLSSAATARRASSTRLRCWWRASRACPCRRQRWRPAFRAMDGHLCRCTGYVRYYAALREVILADPKLTR